MEDRLGRGRARLRGFAALTAVLLALASPARANHQFESFADFDLQGSKHSIFVMDALPAGSSGSFGEMTRPRLVQLFFTVFIEQGSPALPLRVQVYAPVAPTGVYGTLTLLDTSFAAVPGGRAVRSSFPLYYAGAFLPGVTTDIQLHFDQPGFVAGSRPLAISDVSLDWSRPLPEPGTAVLLALGLAGLGALRARRPHPSRVQRAAVGAGVGTSIS